MSTTARKLCSSCKCTLEPGKQGYCKQCARQHHANWRASNRDRVNAYRRSWMAKRRTGHLPKKKPPTPAVKVMFRTDAATHEQIKLAASKAGASMNTWIVSALLAELQRLTPPPAPALGAGE